MLRLEWLERFTVVSKAVLQRHWLETIERYDAYARISPEVSSEILATMEWIVDAFTRCLEEERSFDDEELASFRRLGSTRAQQGVRLDGLRDNFRTGVIYCSDAFTNVAFERSGPEVGQMVTDIVLHELMPLASVAEDALTAGHQEASGHSAGSSPPIEVTHFGLTKQELRVLRLLPGRTNGAIARDLCTSPETVKTHVARILRKLGACDRAHAVAIGASQGLIQGGFAAKGDNSA